MWLFQEQKEKMPAPDEKFKNAPVLIIKDPELIKAFQRLLQRMKLEDAIKDFIDNIKKAEKISREEKQLVEILEIILRMLEPIKEKEGPLDNATIREMIESVVGTERGPKFLPDRPPKFWVEEK